MCDADVSTLAGGDPTDDLVWQQGLGKLNQAIAEVKLKLLERKAAAGNAAASASPSGAARFNVATPPRRVVSLGAGRFGGKPTARSNAFPYPGEASDAEDDASERDGSRTPRRRSGSL